MIFLSDFSVIQPNFGSIFWSAIFFLLFWWLIGRFAFKPIANSLKKRESDIQDALDQAKKAREEMANLKAQNEELLKEAQEEKAQILKEAKEIKDNLINEAKEKAKQEAHKIVMDAKQQIENQRMAAVVDLKNQIGMLSLEIAEKVIKKELKGTAEHESFVNQLVDDIKLN